MAYWLALKVSQLFLKRELYKITPQDGKKPERWVCFQVWSGYFKEGVFRKREQTTFEKRTSCSLCSESCRHRKSFQNYTQTRIIGTNSLYQHRRWNDSSWGWKMYSILPMAPSVICPFRYWKNSSKSAKKVQLQNGRLHLQVLITRLSTQRRNVVA